MSDAIVTYLVSSLLKWEDAEASIVFSCRFLWQAILTAFCWVYVPSASTATLMHYSLASLSTFQTIVAFTPITLRSFQFNDVRVRCEEIFFLFVVDFVMSVVAINWVLSMP